MMQRQVLSGLFIAAHLLLAVNAIGIDDKLDFMGNRDDKNILTPMKYSKTIKTIDDFENIGVVCTSSGCNTTNSKTSGDSVQTDVVVHIQTKVDLRQNTTESTEDTPDIPIVVGYAGSRLDPTVNDDNSQSLGPSIFVPETRTYTSVSNINSIFKPSGSLTPSVESRIDTVGNNFDGTIYTSNPVQSPSITSRIDSFSNSFGSSNPPSGPEGGFYITRPSPVASSVDYINRSFQKLDPAAISGFYPSVNHPRVNNNFRTFSIDASDAGKDVNGIEIKIPYFDPSYHNHYYGEKPPPQLVWNSKKTSGYNPVEFKTVKTTWMPSVWNKKIVPHGHGTILGDGGVKCTCKEESNGSRTGLRWYPNTDTRVPSINDPGSQINDKLAPLN